MPQKEKENISTLLYLSHYHSGINRVSKYCQATRPHCTLQFTSVQYNIIVPRNDWGKKEKKVLHSEACISDEDGDDHDEGDCTDL